jgi:cytochrome d ubiquinol oxidase subunit II
MIVLHGAAWLNLKTEGAIQKRARAVMPFAAITFTLLFILAGVWLARLDGYAITSELVKDGPSNPTLKTVARVAGAWMQGGAMPAVAAALIGATIAVLLRRRPLYAFLGSALVPVGTIATAGLALFPFLLPSSSDPGVSLTVWDASSSKLTLAVMLGATAIFLPLIVIYTGIVYRVLRGPVRESDLDSHSY